MGGFTGLLLLLWVGVTVSTVVDLQKRILGGKKCGDTERLYHVKLIVNKGKQDFLCGGTLISKQWILTAQHCWEDGWTTRAVLGVHPGPGDTVEITAEPKFFKENNMIHDIMLLKLPNPIPPNQIKPAELPDCENHPTPSPNTKAEVQIAGHGATAVNNKNVGIGRSTILKCANVQVADCPTYRMTHHHMFCGGAPKVDALSGDSGGGVVYNGKIYGVIGDGGVVNEPITFMDVCKYKKWINDTIKNNN